MTKQEAIDLFGGKQVSLAKTLGITKSAVNQWPEILDQAKADRVRGAAIRLGIPKNKLQQQ